MANLEDKILDGPRIHYCDAGNDDIRQDDLEDGETRNEASSLFVRPDDETLRLERAAQASWRGISSNTGPKGVIEDFRQRSIQKNSPKSQDEGVDDLETEFQGLMSDDSILKEFVSKRVQDALRSCKPTFGHVIKLQSGPDLLDAIDKEDPETLVLVHIYMRYSRPCGSMNKCLDELAQQFPSIKFVSLDASVTALSANFKENGVPAILAYKKGNLVKSLVQLEEFLDRDFDSYQVAELLRDNGLIT